MAALPVVAAGAAIAGAGISAYGQYQQGQAQQQQYQAQASAAAYQAQVAQNNALIAKQNEEVEIQSGEVAAGNQEMKTRAVVGTTKAGQAASGVDVNSGSFVGVRSAEAELGALDALTIRSDAARKSYGYAVAATSSEAQSGLDTMQSQQDVIAGQEAADAGKLSALGTFIGGVGSVGGKFAGWQNVGA